MFKKVCLGLGVIILSLFMVGCTGKDVTYESNGFKITMEEGFYEKDLVSATVYYESQYSLVTALKEPFEDLAVVNITKDSTIEDYANAVISNNNAEYELKNEDGLNYFTYENSASGKDFFYLSAVFKAEDAFWLVSFACEEENKEEYEPLFKKWAKTVEVE